MDGRVDRRLAVVAAMDMVGYSRHMGEDESGTLANHIHLRDTLIEPSVAEHSGDIVKTTGDGALILFSSATQAVNWAVSLQRQLSQAERAASKAGAMAYRIGINLGDIIHEAGDIYGDGVNVAARLEGIAEPGGVTISEAVFHNVKGKLDLGFRDRGALSLKNISQPVRAYDVLSDASQAGKVLRARTTLRGPARIAFAGVATAVLIAIAGLLLWANTAPREASAQKLLLLPFEAENPQSQAIADAATENMIAALSRLHNVEKAPHAISMEFKGIDVEPSDLPPERGIRYVVGGNAFLDGDQVDLSANLRDFSARSANELWQERASGPEADLFSLLAKLKLGVAAALKVTLSPAEREILEARPTQDVKAYLSFAKAERLRTSGNFFELKESLPLYEDAIARDPEFVEALAAYAEANFIIWAKSYNTIRHGSEALARTEELIAKTLALAPENPHAIGLKVRIAIERRDFEDAVSQARSAIFFQPDEPWLRYILGLALLSAAEYDEAKSAFEEFEAGSPRLNSDEKRNLALQFLLLRDPEHALRLLESIPPEESEVIDQYAILANTYARLGKLDLARAVMEKFRKETVWVSLAWQRSYFGIYADPALFEEWSEAMLAAGLGTSPHGFEEGREADKLDQEELVSLFAPDYTETHKNGPFGMPYSEERRPDGTISMHLGWMNDQPIEGGWEIKGGQFCYRLPAIHTGREDCNNVYIERDKSDENTVTVSNVYSFGVIESVFTKSGTN